MPAIGHHTFVRVSYSLQDQPLAWARRIVVELCYQSAIDYAFCYLYTECTLRMFAPTQSDRWRNTVMGCVFVDPEMSDEERRKSLYAGDILILSPTDGTRSLIDIARRMLEEAFHPH